MAHSLGILLVSLSAAVRQADLVEEFSFYN